MKRILNFNQYNDTKWVKNIDGEDITITIHDVQNFLKDEPIVYIPLNDLEEISIHNKRNDLETIQRANNSDLSYPIIVCKDLDNSYSMVLDGNHRLKKAYMNDKKSIKAKVLDLSKAPINFKKMFSNI